MSRLLLVAACALVDGDGRVLICRRPEGKQLAGLWEFPGGKVEEGETDEEALLRELQEEMEIQVVIKERVIHVEHSYADYDIDFRVYRCELLGGDVKHLRVHDHRWVLPSELDRYEFPAADEKTMRMLLALE